MHCLDQRESFHVKEFAWWDGEAPSRMTRLRSSGTFQCSSWMHFCIQTLLMNWCCIHRADPQVCSTVHVPSTRCMWNAIHDRVDFTDSTNQAETCLSVSHQRFCAWSITHLTLLDSPWLSYPRIMSVDLSMMYCQQDQPCQMTSAREYTFRISKLYLDATWFHVLASQSLCDSTHLLW